MTTFTREHPQTPSKIERLARTSLIPAHRLIQSMGRLGDATKITTRGSQRPRPGFLRRLLSATNLLILSWLCTLWWGERLVLRKSLSACEWHRWEEWPPGARPHHVVLVADPQLVDPHTYPGRPWLLSTLTISYTDMYLRRSYQKLQQSLRPNTLFFLGDLFDGGREWSTSHSTSPEDQFRKYGNDYWMKEFIRFERIFTNSWVDGGMESAAEPRGRKMIASLPGNHDLGFASGIQVPVKERFEAYFGQGNRIDVVGNHTFISVDTVSLSAMDQVDPKTGSSGTGDGTSASAANRNIWGPTRDFLTTMRLSRERALKRELRLLAGLPEQDHRNDALLGYSPKVEDLAVAPKPLAATDLNFSGIEQSFPSILLTHVPLYRAPNTNCGPRRERGSAITVQSGYQYQNVLTPLVSNYIVSKIGAEDVAQVYSGDDHDYCEIEHGEFTGRFKEITVKSMSLAMGVRKPGFLAVSLHNPVEVNATTTDDQHEGVTTKRDTIQNHLCLLPDQLAILMRYAMLLALTLVILVIKAVVGSTKPYKREDDAEALLPIRHEKGFYPAQRAHLDPTVTSTTSSSSSSSASTPDQCLSDRATTTTTTATSLPSHRAPHSDPTNTSRTRSLAGYGNLPASSRSSSPSKAKLDHPNPNPTPPFHSNFFSPAKGSTTAIDERRTRNGVSRGRGRTLDFGLSLATVAIPALLFYGWLVASG